MNNNNVVPIFKAAELKKQREKKEAFDRAKRNILARAAKLDW